MKDTSGTQFLQLTLDGLLAFAKAVPHSSRRALDAAIVAVRNLSTINSLASGGASETELSKTIPGLKVGQCLPVHILRQNAAVIITRQTDELVFEAFELSPLNEQVVKTKGRLVRSFPAAAISVNTTKHTCSDLVPIVAHTLATMSVEPVPDMQPVSTKAGASHEEHRDTTSPAAVTELFFGFLRGLGEPVSVSAVQKKTRDEILWRNAEIPWRRSPMWLMIKVVLQLVLTRSAGGSKSLFKATMLYLLGHVLEKASLHNFPSDQLYAMEAKMLRRMHKLRTMDASNNDVYRLALEFVESLLEEISASLSKSWQAVQKHDTRTLDLKALANLNVERDTHISLPALDTYVASIRSRTGGQTTNRFAPSSGLIKSAPYSYNLPKLPGRNSTEFHYATANLLQFELWVVRRLDTWLQHYAGRVPNACHELHQLMESYHTLASAHYLNNPEGTSVMILTLFELWVACDKMAVRTYPMLSEYDPGVPTHHLQNLLLPFAHQMCRLAKLEAYLEDRTSNSRPTLADKLFSTTHPDCFASRYFDNSALHQALKHQIEKEAQLAADKKKEEYCSLKSNYDILDQQYSESDCQYNTVVVDDWCDPPETKQVHRGDCSKCDYEEKRNALSIKIHEWPLPGHAVTAKVVVFELQAPLWYTSWRDSRIFLLEQVLRGSRDSVDLEFSYSLASGDPHLRGKFTYAGGTPRIGLLSDVKPAVVTHFKAKKIPEVNVSNVCYPNALVHKYYDNRGKKWIGSFVHGNDIANACTYKLSSKQLQKYIFRPSQSPDGEAPNAVLAGQDRCPPNMSLDEYKELSSVPLGHHIQWANILQQLAMPGVDFKKVETTMVFLQCCYQAGPRGNDFLRESHTFFRDSASAYNMLDNLDAAVERVKHNWESAQALSLFSSIASRVLSLNRATRSDAFALLAKIRAVSLGWAHALKEAAHNTSKHEDRDIFVSKSVEVALICIATYDVDDEHLESILDSVPDASMLIQATITVQQGGSAQTWKDKAIAMMRLRATQLLHRCLEIIRKDDAALDDAISHAWPAYMPGPNGWDAASPTADDWVTTEIDATDGNDMRVHYNLLSGELLVNGVPLDQPPQSYRQLPLYRTLFGDAIIEVMPATSAGFQYSTRRTFGDHKVQIGISSTSALIARGIHAAGVVENIPSSTLAKDLPTHFVTKYVHWYNFTSGHVELRPVEDPWNHASAAKWTLERSGRGWRLTKDDDAIVGIQTPTSKAISKIMNPLAEAYHTHCVMQESDNALRIEIPRLDHTFSLAKGSSLLVSKEYPGMVVDGSQELGTLVGFANKLILTSDSGAQILLLAEGMVKYGKNNGHVFVKVDDTNSISKLHAIDVDKMLHRLIDKGDLGCKIYLAYLHALTSFVLPDPLTHMTGTEQALAILDSSAVRSFSQLSQKSIDILASIARLTPGRCYYPKHLKSMQSVYWDGALSFMSQHPRLRTAVQAIFGQARDAQFFDPETKLAFPQLPECDHHLQERDNIRCSSVRVSGFGAEDYTTDHDSRYKSRDQAPTSTRGHNAALMSGLMTRPGTCVHWGMPSTGALWQALCKVQKINGPSSALKSNAHKYYAALTELATFDKVLANFPAHLRTLGQEQSPANRYSSTMWLTALAFAKGAHMDLLQVFAMICKSPALDTAAAPSSETFELGHGIVRTRDHLETFVMSSAYPMAVCPEANTERYANEKRKNYDARRKKLWQAARNSAVKTLTDAFVAQWSGRTPTAPVVDGVPTYINISAATSLVAHKFEAWFDNNLLYSYIGSTINDLRQLDFEAVALPDIIELKAPKSESFSSSFDVEDLFAIPAPLQKMLQLALQPKLPAYLLGENAQPSELGQPRIQSLIGALQSSAESSKYEQRYADGMQKSLDALVAKSHDRPRIAHLRLSAYLDYHEECKEYVEKLYGRLVTSVNSVKFSMSERTVQHWPRISPIFFLQQLAHNRIVGLPYEWKTSIIAYGVALTALQQSERLLRLAQRSHSQEIINELSNPGHENWSPSDYPDSLLMEIESGILIRNVQEQIGGQMRHPKSGNAVMQLNMGEGKSTVITPMVAAALADGYQLVRVLVAKPQSKQMAQMLIAKLGGLVRRRVYYMPFSRSLKLDSAAARSIAKTLEECMRTGGILLVQPEHLLSFRLMPLECFLTEKEDLGAIHMQTQDFFDQQSRDIVDESDENFSPRFELIYTIGMQQLIEFHPYRWTFMQQVLDLVKSHAVQIAEDLPSSIEVQDNGVGGFPRVRLLRGDATKDLVERVAKHIRDHGLQAFPVARQSQKLRSAIFEYITQYEPAHGIVELVESGEFWRTSSTPLLLLRGILACGVLAFTLGQKRWRVNYGLAPRDPPTKLAVPYRAKDSPSLRSEFSHPDVVITLTSLCYYYGGLDDDDMFIAFGTLVDSDQADAEYQLWIKHTPALPSTFRQLQGINLKDRLQCITMLFPRLRKNKAVVDYFLSRIVFPKEMKQFPHKLSASGWDIGKQKKLPTTGFSGTSDSRHLLPLYVQQLDLNEQTHTNAMVLEYLLQPINGIELATSAPAIERLTDAEQLLSTVLRLDPPVEVILDVGAQILELDNLGVAKAWLKMSDPEKEAVVFVNDSDELCVVDRRGRVDMLQTSPFAARLSACLVFLDESHTRGTDLKLPLTYRAAVTLGANLTKDRLAQACMRLRKLGLGQSVVFCVSQEIQAKIEEIKPDNEHSTITLADVLLWSIHETHKETRRSVPLWSVQGERFIRQEKIWQSMIEDGKTVLSQSGAESLLEEEAQSIEFRYSPQQSESQLDRLVGTPDLELQRIVERCRDFDKLQFNASTLQEEQERELSPEIEQEQQVQKAPPGEPATHKLHQHVLDFARSGVIRPTSEAYMSAFKSLQDSSASAEIDLDQLAGDRNVLVTADFATVIKKKDSSGKTDAFQRQVQWVLTRRPNGSDNADCVMVVSEYEANLLLPRMNNKSTTLHKYKARCNAGYDALDNLDLFAVSGNSTLPILPRGLSVQLGLFAGQLYISSYYDYLEICKFLGICATPVTSEMSDQGWQVSETDGFILKDDKGKVGGDSGLTKSPLSFFKVLMSRIRRNGDGISKTHMGHLLEGEMLLRELWEDEK